MVDLERLDKSEKKSLNDSLSEVPLKKCIDLVIQEYLRREIFRLGNFSKEVKED